MSQAFLVGAGVLTFAVISFLIYQATKSKVTKLGVKKELMETRNKPILIDFSDETSDNRFNGHKLFDVVITSDEKDLNKRKMALTPLDLRMEGKKNEIIDIDAEYELEINKDKAMFIPRFSYSNHRDIIFLFPKFEKDWDKTMEKTPLGIIFKDLTSKLNTEKREKEISQTRLRSALEMLHASAGGMRTQAEVVEFIKQMQVQPQMGVRPPIQNTTQEGEQR